jgi:putative SOS response-associated peptidase YedK
LAEQASAAGKKAKTRVEWLDLAHQWQQASDLMGQVKADDSRYSTAQDRVQLYQQNSEAALQQAERLKS